MQKSAMVGNLKQEVAAAAACETLDRFSVGVGGGFRGFWLPYQARKPIPRCAQIRPPTHCGLQIHPQARSNRMGTYDLEPHGL
jgi:hypothetical protein